jgi:predicted anti-sigma-YlaC factor YlaD
MNCQDIARFLLDYLDGELTAEHRTTFEEHLGECPDCIAYLQTFRETVRLSRASDAGTPESQCQAIPEDLVNAILAARKSERN